MASDKLSLVIDSELKDLEARGILKGKEKVITAIIPGSGEKGPRVLIKGFGNREFLKMNSNSYLGLSLRKELVEVEENTVKTFGVGPGAGRSLSGTYEDHVELEKELAKFHGKEAGMIFSSAYSAVVGTLFALISEDTVVLSDELNHNCIINGIRLSRPREKKVYIHNNMLDLHKCLKASVGHFKRAIVVTDGIFSMRGEHAPLKKIADLLEEFNDCFEEGALLIVDDSHGVGASGETGRGAMELTGENRVDVLIATMGKALGVNGGYVVSKKNIIIYLKEKAPFYVYSNSITQGEASAIRKSLEILDSEQGRAMLKHLKETADYFRKGLVELGYEVIPSLHPIVPLMIRDTMKTKKLVRYLEDHNVFTAGIFYPIVPKGDELIRFQVSRDHTKFDIDFVLGVLHKFKTE
jgi:glycine C-acetyltransferase